VAAEENSPVGYTYKSLSAATGMSARFWRREVALGRIPSVKFDQAVMILHADLARYLASRRRVKNEEAQEQVQSLATAA
jgi:hypothetical protein